tara:strand:- start:9 stop:260 length:252 start_codon:yes stop_codon:yes gene_type:complete
MSFKTTNDENIEFTIFFKDYILETVLKGLNTLNARNDLNYVSVSSNVNHDVITIIKSNLFQLSLKYDFGFYINLIIYDFIKWI